jgi:hypothetical protein
MLAQRFVPEYQFFFCDSDENLVPLFVDTDSDSSRTTIRVSVCDSDENLVPLFVDTDSDSSRTTIRVSVCDSDENLVPIFFLWTWIFV